MKNLFCKALLLCAASLLGLTSCDDSDQEVNIIIPVESVSIEAELGFSALYPATNTIYFNIGDGSEADLAATDPIQLSVTISPSDATNKSVSWLCSDTAVAVINADGLVTPVGGGTANIYAIAGSQQTGTVETAIRVVVDKDPYSDDDYSDLTLSDDEITLYINVSEGEYVYDTYTLSAELSRSVTGYTVDDVRWKSEKESVATVDELTGEVTAVARSVSGTNIYAYIGNSWDDYVVRATCLANVYTTVYDISIGTTFQSETRVISVEEYDLDNKDITYGGVTAGTEVTDSPYVGLVAELRDGDSDLSLSATLVHSQPYDSSVTWTSSDWTVATVDSATGVVQIVGPGYSIVTASANGIYPDSDPVTDTILIYVSDQEPIALESVYISSDANGIVNLTEKGSDGNPYAMVGMGKYLRLYANLDPYNATDAIEKWSVTSNVERFTSNFEDESVGILEGGTLKDGEIDTDITIAVSVTAGGSTAANTGYVKVIREAEELKITNTVTSMPMNSSMQFAAQLYVDDLAVSDDNKIYDDSVTWTVEEGNDYAFIEANSGTLMVKAITAGLDNTVTVRATANNGSWETDIAESDRVTDYFSFKIVENLVAIASTTIEDPKTVYDATCDDGNPYNNGFTEIEKIEDAKFTLQANYDVATYNNGVANTRTITLRTYYLAEGGGDEPTNTATEWSIDYTNGASDTVIKSQTDYETYSEAVIAIGEEVGTIDVVAASTSNGLYDKSFFDQNVTAVDRITLDITNILVREVLVSADNGATGMSQGDELTLYATLVPTYAADQNVSWAATGGNDSGASSVGSVTPNSKAASTDLFYTFEALSAGGYVNVLATATNQYAAGSMNSDPYRVDIGTYPTTIELDVTSIPTSGHMYVGDTYQLNTTGYNASSSTVDIIQTVVWTSSNTSVASVSADGVVTATGKGEATITATSAGVVPGTSAAAYDVCSVDISGYEITGLDFTVDPYIAAVGSQIDLSKIVDCDFKTSGYNNWKGSAFNEDVTYVFTSDNSSILNLNNNTTGVMTPLSVGSVTITVVATGVDSGLTATNSVTVTVKNAIDSVEIAENGTSVNNGVYIWVDGDVNVINLVKSDVFTGNQSNSETTTCSWSSSNTKYATVDNNGNVTVLGSTNEAITIYATVTGDVSGLVKVGEYTFTIGAGIDSITLSTSTLSLYEDEGKGSDTGTVTFKTEPFNTGVVDSAVWKLSGATMSYTDSDGVEQTGVAIADITDYLTVTDNGINGYTIKIKDLDPESYGYTNVNIEATLSVVVTYNGGTIEVLSCKVYVYDTVTTPGFDLGGDL
ncbi:MAG: Ig-like domain-containing protein [Rikenellaceae bacterium]